MDHYLKVIIPFLRNTISFLDNSELQPFSHEFHCENWGKLKLDHMGSANFESFNKKIFITIGLPSWKFRSNNKKNTVKLRISSFFEKVLHTPFVFLIMCKQNFITVVKAIYVWKCFKETFIDGLSIYQLNGHCWI